ncbi:MAG: ATP-binding protein [Coprothermobacterota bacterium]|nr:ATP-binding protein [Coprothermobacterota bacterium]
MNLEFLNPWWKDGRVSAALVGRRRGIFHEAMAIMNVRQILAITGLRRVGKTTLMYQVIDELLKSGVDPYHILYYSFDEGRADLDGLLKQYETDVLKDDLRSGRMFLFFDEIQKLPDWPGTIKILFDALPSCKIVISGSARIGMWKDTRESLAGRFFELAVAPLDFEEYLAFQDLHLDPSRENLYEKDLKIHLASYLKTGGFVEAMNLDDAFRRKYFREGFLERVVFLDIPQAMPLQRPELLMAILRIVAERPGLYLEVNSLSNDLRCDQRTLANYLDGLEYALLIQKLYNYSKNLLTSEKKMKRLYLANTAFTWALNPQIDFSLLIEQWFVNWTRARFFLRTPQKEEIDIIHRNDQEVLLPIEVKMQERIDPRDGKILFRFLERAGISAGLMITLNAETRFEVDQRLVEAVPYWKYWTVKACLEGKST